MSMRTGTQISASYLKLLKPRLRFSMLFEKNKMAELSEVFELSKVPFSRSFFIESGESKNEVILSSKKSGFIRCNIENRKVVQSWPITHNQDLTTSCIFHPGDLNYYAVLQDKNLYNWTNADAHLTNAAVTQLILPTEIKKLHPVTCGGINDLVILDVREKAYLLSNVKKLTEEHSDVEKTNHGKKYIWSTFLPQTESRKLNLLVIVEEGQKYKMNSISLKLENEAFIFEQCKESVLAPPIKGSHLISCTLQENRLVVLWSDTSICVLDLKLTDQDLMANSKLIQKLSSEFKIAGKGISKAKIGMVNTDHIFIVSKYVDGDKRLGVVAVMNTKFGTEQARIFFPLTKPGDSSTKEQDILSAGFHAGHVILAMTNSVMASACSIRSSSLAASLGKLKRPRSEMTKDEKTIISDSPFFITSKLKRSIKEENSDKKALAKNIEEQKTLDRLSDPKKTPTIEEFRNELDKYLKKLKIQVVSQDVEKEEDEPATKKPKENPKDKNRNLIVPVPFMQAVFSRCLTNDELWSSKVIVKVLKTSCIPQSLCKDLIQKILESNSLDVMEKCFRYVKDISENDVVQCLKYLLCIEPDRNDTTNLKTLGRPTAAGDDVVYDKTCFEILLSILNYSFNDYTMQEALRMLNRQETKKLLQTLYHLLIVQSPGIDVGISHETVVDWLSLVINAQFTSLILGKDLTKMIRHIKLTVQNQMKLYEKLESIEPCLLYFKKTFKLPKTDKIRSYSVETINI